MSLKGQSKWYSEMRPALPAELQMTEGLCRIFATSTLNRYTLEKCSRSIRSLLLPTIRKALRNAATGKLVLVHTGKIQSIPP